MLLRPNGSKTDNYFNFTGEARVDFHNNGHQALTILQETTWSGHLSADVLFEHALLLMCVCVSVCLGNATSSAFARQQKQKSAWTALSKQQKSRN